MAKKVPTTQILGRARTSTPGQFQFESHSRALAKRCDKLAASAKSPLHQKEIASTVENARKYGIQISPFSQLHSFTSKQAYEIAAEARLLRTKSKAGYKSSFAVGRKIGFTNKNIWEEYNINGPIWGYMYSSTCKNWKVDEPKENCFDLQITRHEPKIEPEIVFGIKKPPHKSMSDRDLLNCVSWIGHGFEIVDSLYPAWMFDSNDAIIAGALHRCLLLDQRQLKDVSDFPFQIELLTQLENFRIDLYCNGKIMDSGTGSNVLGGPINALRFLVELLEKQSLHPGIQPGEIITTGTLTKALAISDEDEWHSEIGGIDLPGYRTRFKFTEYLPGTTFVFSEPTHHRVAKSETSGETHTAMASRLRYVKT